MCLLISLMLSGPRVVIVAWWLIAMSRWEATFDSFLLPFFGLIFLPWTTLMAVIVSPAGNVDGIDWMWLGLAFVADLASVAGSRYGRRRRQRSRRTGPDADWELSR